MDTQQDTSIAPAPQLGEAAALAASGMGEVVMQHGEAVAREMQAGSRQWMTWVQKGWQTNLKAWQALMMCRSPTAVLAVHTVLMQEHLKLMASAGPRLAPAVAKPARSPRVPKPAS
jgi:hypothetical protein